MKCYLPIVLSLVCATWANAIPDFELANDLLPRTDDGEWTLVIYPKHKDDQCGGTSKTYTGTAKKTTCLSLGEVTACAKIKVNAGFASCEFEFKKTCGDSAETKVKVDKDSDDDFVKMSDIKFVTIDCSE